MPSYKLTPELIVRAGMIARNGLPLTRGADLLGISRQTIWVWAKRGQKELMRRWRGEEPREAEQPYVDFVQTVRQADAARAESLLKLIEDAAKVGTWQAAAWLLERRWPDDFSNNNRELMRLNKELIELMRMNRPPQGSHGSGSEGHHDDEDEDDEEEGDHEDGTFECCDGGDEDRC